MKYHKTDFLSADHFTIPVDAWLEESGESFLFNTDVRSVQSCHVTGSLYFDGKDLVSSRLNLVGQMIVPDSITDEDRIVDFETESERLYSFAHPSEDDMDIVFAPRETVDLLPEIFEAIVYEAPAGYTELRHEDYPKGEGWELITDEDLKEEKPVDERWAALKDFKFED